MNSMKKEYYFYSIVALFSFGRKEAGNNHNEISLVTPLHTGFDQNYTVTSIIRKLSCKLKQEEKL